jgi:ribose-phosphate pyrophosphokinase
MIRYKIAGVTTNVSVSKFPDGDVKANINVGSKEPDNSVKSVRVSVALHGSDDILALLQTVDALRRHYPVADLSLAMPYVPYARQDRPCVNGEALSAAVLANLVNLCGFSTVEVLDAHSDVIPALIKNCTNVPQAKIFKKIFDTYGNFYIVAPDAGAYKKAHNLAKDIGAKGVICANKVRNPATGKIERVSVSENIQGLNLLVADDLCDGGRTFTELANVLRKGGCASLQLVVTHGLFTKGVEVLLADGMYDKVFTTNSYHHQSEGNVDQNGVANDKVQWVKVV